MKIVVETKFKIGDKAIYNPEASNLIIKNKVHFIEIKEIIIICHSKNNELIVDYNIKFIDSFRDNKTVREKNLYKTLEIMNSYKRKLHKELLKRNIKQLSSENKDIMHDLKRNKKEINEFEEKLEEIKKEELIIELSGISKNKQ